MAELKELVKAAGAEVLASEFKINQLEMQLIS